MKISVKTQITADRSVPEVPNIWKLTSTECFIFILFILSGAKTSKTVFKGRESASHSSAAVTTQSRVFSHHSFYFDFDFSVHVQLISYDNQQANRSTRRETGHKKNYTTAAFVPPSADNAATLGL